jgi:hypothetical protein
MNLDKFFQNKRNRLSELKVINFNKKQGSNKYKNAEFID